MQISDEEMLVIANLSSRGLTLAEAKEIVLGQRSNTLVEKSDKKPKVSPKEQKEEIAAEIKKLGGKAPSPSASLPNFKQALAKAQKANKGGETGLESLM